MAAFPPRRGCQPGIPSMKRTERRHLKENELQTLARQARETFEERRRETAAIVAVAAVVAIGAIGYYAWHQRVQGKAHALLAEALSVRDARVGPAPASGTPPTGGPSFATE